MSYTGYLCESWQFVLVAYIYLLPCISFFKILFARNTSYEDQVWLDSVSRANNCSLLGENQETSTIWYLERILIELRQTPISTGEKIYSDHRTLRWDITLHMKFNLLTTSKCKLANVLILNKTNFYCFKNCFMVNFFADFELQKISYLFKIVLQNYFCAILV